MTWLKGLDEYYQPPDPPPFIPGEISWAEELALDCYLEWYDDALDFEDILETIKEGEENYFKLRPEFQDCEHNISNLIGRAAKQIEKYAINKTSVYNTTVNRLIGVCESYIEFSRKGLITDHSKIADRMEVLIKTLDDNKGK